MCKVWNEVLIGNEFHFFWINQVKLFIISKLFYILFWLCFSILLLPIIVNRYTCLNEIFNNSPLSLFVSPHPSYFRKTAHFCSKLLMAKCMNRERCCRSSIWGVPKSTTQRKDNFYLMQKVVGHSWIALTAKMCPFLFLKSYLKSILQKS